MTARPTTVAGNDWRSITPADTPTEGVTVVISYYDAEDALALTLASLERQTYPRGLFEVIVVDDGSPKPLDAPESPLDLRVVHQDDRGFGLARARNTGATAAAHDIVVFLDCDMLCEPGWLHAHARWHHAASDALTLGFRSHVDTAGLTARAIRDADGSLADLLSDRASERPEWIEYHMARTNDLTSADDDLFRVVTGGNLGVRKSFLDEVGGFDESFTQWGAEDTEFGYRATAAGAILIPEREAACVHQGLGTTPDESEAVSLEQQRAKIAHLIAHRGFRRALPGRSFTVPQYLVSVTPGEAGAAATLETVEQILANRVHDLVVWVTPRPADPGHEWLVRQLSPDPRVRFGDEAAAWAATPAAAFHVRIPAGSRLREYAIGNLRTELGDHAWAQATLQNGRVVSITRAWAAARARRAGVELAAIAPVRTLSWKDIGVRSDKSPGRGSPFRRLRDPESRVGRVLRQLQRVRTPAQAWRFLRWAGSAARQRLGGPSTPPAPELTAAAPGAGAATATYPLGVEIGVVGATAAAVFAASARITDPEAMDRVDVVLADQAVERAEPVVVVSDAPPSMQVPAFDPQQSNPLRWVRADNGVVGSPGPVERLPNGAGAAEVDVNDADRLRVMHHLEDVAAFHATLEQRAGALVEWAGRGVVTRVADDDRRLAELIGRELYGLFRRDDIVGADAHTREALSIAMRRAAHRDHSIRARARQLVDVAGLAALRPPAVSVLLATNRPDYLENALSSVAKQSYPNLELVLALHGGSFSGEVESKARELAIPVRVVRVAHELTLGDALNTAVSAASGRLLTKFDDDDLYAADHVWDLVLAHEYSGAALVAKAAEYVYLAGTDATIHRFVGRGETFSTTLAGGTMLISRDDLAEAGGWRRVPRSVDRGLIDDVEAVGGSVYRTHGSGYILVRHGKGHTWASEDAYFLDQAEDQRPGLDEGFASI